MSSGRRSSREFVLHCVASLYSLSSSEGLRLATREAAREPAGELFFEPTVEPGAFDFALRDTVLPLSSACLRKSCMLDK